MHRLALDLRFRSFALTKSEIGMCARLQFCAGMLSLETFNRSPRSVGASVPLMAFGDGEALEQTLDADGRTEYRVKPRKTKAIESDTQLNVAAPRLRSRRASGRPTSPASSTWPPMRPVGGTSRTSR